MTTSTALQALRDCRSGLVAARLDARIAATNLAGARANRADELAEKIADALAFVERLCFVVEADIRYEEESRAMKPRKRRGVGVSNGFTRNARDSAISLQV